jgi:hypothetical protein
VKWGYERTMRRKLNRRKKGKYRTIKKRMPGKHEYASDMEGRAEATRVRADNGPRVKSQKEEITGETTR